MLYDLPEYIHKPAFPQWPKGVAGIPAVLPHGEYIDIPVMKGINCLTLGVVGTGKTASFTAPAAEKLLSSNPTMKGVFFEIKRTFIDRFMNSDDKVITYNASDIPKANLFVPNIIKEIRQSNDKNAEMFDFANFLFAELLKDGERNLVWIEAARDTFIAVLRTIVDCYPDADTTNKTLINALRRMSTKDILSYIAKHTDNHSIIYRDWDCDPNEIQKYKPGQRAADIQFFFNQALEKFSGTFIMDGTDTIQNWLDGKYGKNLFLLYDLKKAEISRPFFLYYLRKIKNHKMSNTVGNTSPVLMVLDEIDKMSEGGKTADFGLFQAANLGRENGLQILLTSQSLENLFGCAPDFNEHITNGGLAGFPQLLCFRLGDPKTISTMQTLFGSEYRERIILPASRYDNVLIKSDKEPIITDEEFASLRTGECVIKIDSHRPQKVYINMEGK